MRSVFKKIENVESDKICVNYYLFNKILILQKSKSYTLKKTYILGLCISSKKLMDTVLKNTIDINCLEYLKNYKNNQAFGFWQNFLRAKTQAKKIIYWFDHTGKGGTELYSINKINELKEENLIIRIQNNGSNAFLITYFYKTFKDSLILNNENEIYLLINNIIANSVVVNNLATYKNGVSILSLIKKTKEKFNFTVTYMAHDYQAFCPVITMVNNENTYCNEKNINHCESCIKCFKKIPINIDSVKVYQDGYSFFLNNVVDNIIVFSKSTKDIYLQFYPEIAEKIEIIPHNVKAFRKVKIKPHEPVNIAVLGNLAPPKGSLVVKKLDEIIPNYKNINIKLIGICKGIKFKNIKVTGLYKLEELPDIIEREQIDIVFIPSVCPETFSFTASEALSMGLPIACFNLGAPVEKIIPNVNGIVFDNYDCNVVLNKLRDFIIKKRCRK